ncbi:sphingomyelinase C SmcL [Listeria ivanovii]|uniref:Putative sphingomyelinase-c n=1 Tax=Listeria ivanovii (strain ATCC BAA-678 / PAM 55) TaxID=881621 RepID=G2ZF69_LISIP|nr:sphingomyelinase C SmcL [Listeria ivanovii]AHI55730.1 phospholipase C [Listeria ivanovii WSLC3009]AIS65177.1 phospholipase C [Listeria ivanovii subsp. ivanovii]MBK3914671.1 sphingomyelin phosphodiesterase [Listeria ivanovii subsp. ivanovii]MBK3921431.1 sphingomyelin phosphodiesterase [Listeria ivanovii subsp. ivanovii]MBK3926595.1 sphingomyelin phosphodiesterase [Listeria ivanovii subsp. ivanovii]
MEKFKIIKTIPKICGAFIFLLFFTFLFGHYGELKTQASDEYPGNFKITSHNVYLFSRNIYPNWGQMHRADLIAQADYMKNNDVVILNEAFDTSASHRLLNNLREMYPHQTPVIGRSKHGWDKTEGNYSNFALEDGGVAVVSQWPIVEKSQHIFQRGGGADRLSNKGFAYVKIMKNGKPYHIIGTHTQADDSLISKDTSRAIRAEQMQEIQTFIAKKNIPKDEIIFIGGDLNVNYGTDEYHDMLKLLNVSSPANFNGQMATWDPTTNSMLKESYPKAAPEYLDYIFVENGHARPHSWHNKVLHTKSPQWSVKSWFKTYTYQDFSDHYPVVGFTDNN